MTWGQIYPVAFVFGSLWSLAALLLGGLHFHLPNLGGHHTHFGGGHSHGAHSGAADRAGHVLPGSSIHFALNPHCLAVFLAWFGGAGYLLERHSRLGLGLRLTFAVLLGLAGMMLLAYFLRWLQSAEKPLDPADYDLVGKLATVSGAIGAESTGEVIYQRDGARCPLFARSEDRVALRRGDEVIVTRYEKGIAYVRTWDVMENTRKEKVLL